MNTTFDKLSKEEKIAAINAAYETVEKEVAERCAYRRQNYYDCIDDYSEYGPCWKADMAERDAARYERDLKLEEVNGDGTHKEVTHRYALLNENGDEVASELCSGRYGYYWYDTAKGCYVGTPRKISTLTKKGYTLVEIVNTYACKVSYVKIGMKVHNSSMVLVNSEKKVLTEIPEYMCTGKQYAEWQYEAFFKEVA